MTEQKFRFLSFKDWIPDPLRFWIYILFLLAFQFSNGMYFSAMSQMSGGLSLTMNDVKMLSYAMLMGQTMFFPLAFRLKFRFTNRTCLLSAACGLALCNLIVPHVHNLLALVFLCFVGGLIRLWGTFECLSTLMPKIAPTHNFALFLSFVFFIVLGVINLFDLICVRIIYYYRWEYLHYTATILLGVVFLAAYFMMQPYRIAPKMPLLGLDGYGFILWSAFLLLLIFVAQYGNQLNWLHSPYIRAALGAAALAFGFLLIRMNYFRHPFLDISSFRSKHLTVILWLFLFLGILLEAKSVLQNIFTSGILQFDAINLSTAKLFEFAGSLTGAVTCWFALSRPNRPYKLMTFIGMGAVIFYTAAMYFLVSPQTNLEKLYLPLFFCGFGHLVIYITLTVYCQAVTPFKNFFQVLCILGLIRTGIASPIGDAIYSRAFDGLISKHLATLTDGFNAAQMQLQAVLGAMRELFGWSVVFGVMLLVLISLAHFQEGATKSFLSLKNFYKKYSASEQHS